MIESPGSALDVRDSWRHISVSASGNLPKQILEQRLNHGEKKVQKAENSLRAFFASCIMATLSADRIARPDSIDANIPNPGLEVCCSGTLTYYLSNLAASNFIDAYYQTLESSTGNIESFYMPHTTMRGKALPSIIWNGNVFYDPEKVAKLFREKMPETHYSIQNYDCQLLNYHYVAEDQHPNPETAMNLVILIMVSGTVTYGYGTARLPVPRGFSDSIVLVPNPAAGFKAHGKPIKDWLIQSQTFRHVV